MTATLTAISPLDGRYANKLTHLTDVASEYGLINYRVQVEIEWFRHLSNHPDIKELKPLTPEENQALDAILSNFDHEQAQRIKTIEAATNHDVKAVEYYLVEQFKAHETLQHKTAFIHFACTSEDINNLAHGLTIKALRDTVIVPSIKQLTAQLKALSTAYAQQPMLARTHGQTATPTTIGKELAIFNYRLNQQLLQLQSIAIKGKINGATGNFNAHLAAYPNVNWQQLAETFIHHLGLSYNPLTTQIEPHDYIAEIFHCLTRINTIVIDCCRDVWGYVSLGYFKQKVVKNEVGSSTMPHKVNPIDFENAEGNLGLSNALLKHMAEKLCISRWQRDLSDSTVLRNIGSAIAYAELSYHSCLKGLNKLDLNPEIINQDLENAWEVLAEPLQTVMRKHGINDAYDKIKEHTRGKAFTQQNFEALVNQLALPTEAVEALLALTPSKYIGIAIDLASKD